MKSAGLSMVNGNSTSRRDRLFIFCVCLGAFACAMWMRLLELPYWTHPALRMGADPILGTHDAYAWLAGVRGIGTGAATAPAQFLGWVSELLGTSPEWAAFWLPPVLASLVAPVCALCAYSLAGPQASIIAGLLGAVAPAFVHRTRLGFYDTDIVMLLVPLTAGWLLLAWLGPRVRRIRLRSSVPDCGWSLFLPGVAGACFALAGGWHSALTVFSGALLGIGLFLALLFPVRGLRPELLAGMAAFAAVCGLGWAGSLLAVGIGIAGRVGLFKRVPGDKRTLAALVLLVAVVGLSPQVRGAAATLEHRIERYASRDVEFREQVESKAQKLAVYPGVIQSVLEAKKLDPFKVSGMISGNEIATWVGLAGLLVCMALRPAALVLLPLAVLPFLSQVLGGRVLMFGGPAVAIGLGAGVFGMVRFVCGRTRWHGLAQVAMQVALALVLLLPLYKEYTVFRPAPVISKPVAQALDALGEVARRDSGVWIWWDWGYAAQHFSGLTSFADGARHSGEYLFPLGLTFTTPEPRQARQMMQYAAIKGYKPWEIFDKREADEVWAFINSLVTSDYALSAAPPQYIVTSWDALGVSHWVTYYGTWDVERATGRKGGLQRLHSKVSVGADGSIEMPDGRTLRLATLDVLGKDGVTRKEWPGRRRAHLLVNEVNQQMLLVGDITYNGMLARLLVSAADDPELNEEFELVYEGFPFVRIWRARDFSN